MAKDEKKGRPIDPLKNVRTDESGRVVAIYKQSVAQVDASRRYDKKLHHIGLRLPAEYKELIQRHIQRHNDLYPDTPYKSVNSFIKSVIDADFEKINAEYIDKPTKNR